MSREREETPDAEQSLSHSESADKVSEIIQRGNEDNTQSSSQRTDSFMRDVKAYINRDNLQRGRSPSLSGIRPASVESPSLSFHKTPVGLPTLMLSNKITTKNDDRAMPMAQLRGVRRGSSEDFTMDPILPPPSESISLPKQTRRYSSDDMYVISDHNTISSATEIQLSILRQKLEEYKDEMKVAGILGDNLYRENGQLKDKTMTLEDEIKMLQDTSSIHASDLQHSELSQQDLSVQVSQLTLKLRQTERKGTNLVEENSHLKSENDKLHEETNRLRTLNETAHIDMQRLRDDLDMISQNAESNIAEFQQQMADLQDSHSTLRREYHNLRKQHQITKKQLDQKNGEVTSLEKQIHSLKREQETSELALPPETRARLQRSKSIGVYSSESLADTTQELYQMIDQKDMKINSLEKLNYDLEQFLKNNLQVMETLLVDPKKLVTEDVWSNCNRTRQYLGVNEPPPKPERIIDESEFQMEYLSHSVEATQPRFQSGHTSVIAVDADKPPIFESTVMSMSQNIAPKPQFEAAIMSQSVETSDKTFTSEHKSQSVESERSDSNFTSTTHQISVDSAPQPQYSAQSITQSHDSIQPQFESHHRSMSEDSALKPEFTAQRTSMITGDTQRTSQFQSETMAASHDTIAEPQFEGAMIAQSVDTAQKEFRSEHKSQSVNHNHNRSDLDFEANTHQITMEPSQNDQYTSATIAESRDSFQPQFEAQHNAISNESAPNHQFSEEWQPPTGVSPRNTPPFESERVGVQSVPAIKSDLQSSTVALTREQTHTKKKPKKKSKAKRKDPTLEEQKFALVAFFQTYANPENWQEGPKENGTQTYVLRFGAREPLHARMSYLYAMTLYLGQIVGVDKRCITHAFLLLKTVSSQIDTLADEFHLILTTLEHHDDDKLWKYIFSFLYNATAYFKHIRRFVGTRTKADRRSTRSMTLSTRQSYSVASETFMRQSLSSRIDDDERGYAPKHSMSYVSQHSLTLMGDAISFDGIPVMNSPPDTTVAAATAAAHQSVHHRRHKKKRSHSGDRDTFSSMESGYRVRSESLPFITQSVPGPFRASRKERQRLGISMNKDENHDDMKDID